MRLISAIVLSLLTVQLHSCMALASDEDYTEEYWMDKASILELEGHYDLALMCINKSLEINSNNSDTWTIKGSILRSMKSYNESLNCYEKAIQIDPLNEEAWMKIRDISDNDLNNRTQTIRALDSLSALDPQNDFYFIRKGGILAGLGRYDEAVKAYGQAIALKPQISNYWKLKADALNKQGNFKAAIQAYDRALELSPRSYYLFQAKAEALYGQGKFDQAEKVNETFAEFQKAESLRYSGKYNEAIQAYDRAINLSPQYSYFWLMKARTLFLQSKYDEADRAYDRAIGLDPGNPNLWEAKAYILWYSGRYFEALLSYFKARPKFTIVIFLAIFTAIVIIIKRKSFIRMIRGKKVSQSETLEQALTVFEGVKSPILSALFRGIPYITVPIIIYCISQDWMLIPGVLALLLLCRLSLSSLNINIMS